MMLLAVQVAAAMPWWVETPAEGEALAAELAVLWPEESPSIQTGGAPDAVGVHLIGDTLTWITADGSRSQPGIPDWSTAVVLVRSWSARLAVEPPPPTPEPPPPAPEPPPPPTPSRGYLSAPAGPATRRPDPSPAFHFAGEVGLGHVWVIPLVVELDPAERVPIGEDSETVWVESSGVGVVRRLGALSGIARTVPLGERTLEAGLYLGVRRHTLTTTLDDPEQSTLLLPTAAARLRVWSSRPQIGVGLMASLDGLGGDFYPDLSGYAPVREQTLAVEVGVRWRKKT
jgi:hypothetical protein